MNKSALVSLAKKAIPPSVMNTLRQLKARISDLDLGYPVVQMYVNQEGIRTHIALNDFYTFLVPEAKALPHFTLNFYGSEGKFLFSHSDKLDPLGALRIDVRKLFEQRGVTSAFGLVSLQITPHNPKKMEYKRMGQVGSFFYVFYEHDDGSVGHVHPSSILDPKNSPSDNFLSNQAIFTKGLEGIRLMQCNPAPKETQVLHEIIDLETQEVLRSRSTTLPANGVRLVDFDFKAEPLLKEKVTIRVSPLPTCNSKPVLVRKYSNNRWSYSHS